MVFKKAVLVLKSGLGLGLTGLGLEKIGGLGLSWSYSLVVLLHHCAGVCEGPK